MKNKKIPHGRNSSTIKKNRRNGGKIDTPNTNIHDTEFPVLVQALQ